MSCDHVPVYTGWPGETHIELDLETGRCAIYIGKDEPDPGAAYRRALDALLDRCK